jgi:hypothetical protein
MYFQESAGKEWEVLEKNSKTMCHVDVSSHDPRTKSAWED